MEKRYKVEMTLKQIKAIEQLFGITDNYKMYDKFYTLRLKIEDREKKNVTKRKK
jgi:hypothetical protein